MREREREKEKERERERERNMNLFSMAPALISLLLGIVMFKSVKLPAPMGLTSSIVFLKGHPLEFFSSPTTQFFGTWQGLEAQGSRRANLLDFALLHQGLQ